MQEHHFSPTGRFERILLAVDGSQYSEGAIRIAAAMARKCDSELYVMSIGIVDPEYSTLVSNLEFEAEKKAQANVDAAIATMSGVTCRRTTALRCSGRRGSPIPSALSFFRRSKRVWCGTPTNSTPPASSAWSARPRRCSAP